MQEQRHKRNKAEPKQVKKEFREESSSMKQRITLETKSQVGWIKSNQGQMTKEEHQELVHTYEWKQKGQFKNSDATYKRYNKQQSIL